jgi:hypothetical protein
MSGFRPGTLGKVRYKDVLLSVMHDPVDKETLKHAATITIPRNKLKNSLGASKANRKSGNKFSEFPMSRVHSLLNLVGLSSLSFPYRSLLFVLTVSLLHVLFKMMHLKLDTQAQRHS